MSIDQKVTQKFSINDLVYVGFNRQVIALDRYNGKKVWDLKASRGAGFPSLLLDGDRLIVSVHGYTHCLEPITGGEVWMNEPKGYGTGIPNIVSVHGSSSQNSAVDVINAQQSVAITSTGTSGVGT